MLIDRSFPELLTGDARTRDPRERRATPRVSLEVDVRLRGAGHASCGVSDNVSAGGLCVWTYRLFPRESRVTVGFRLPGGHVIADAVVSWMQEGRPGRLPRIGLQFTELDAADCDRLAIFCRTQSRLPQP